MAISTRMSRNPVTPSAQSPSIGARPSSLEAKFGEELNGGVDVFYHDADVVHTLDRHDVSLASNSRYHPRPKAVGCMPLLDSTNPAASREKISIPPTPEYGDQERNAGPTAHFCRGCAGEKHYDERDADDRCCTACCN